MKTPTKFWSLVTTGFSHLYTIHTKCTGSAENVSSAYHQDQALSSVRWFGYTTQGYHWQIWRTICVSCGAGAATAAAIQPVAASMMVEVSIVFGGVGLDWTGLDWTGLHVCLCSAMQILLSSLNCASRWLDSSSKSWILSDNSWSAANLIFSLPDSLTELRMYSAVKIPAPITKMIPSPKRLACWTTNNRKEPIWIKGKNSLPRVRWPLLRSVWEFPPPCPSS